MRLVRFQGNSPEVSPTAYIAETAVLIGDVKVGAHSSIWESAVLRGDWNKIDIGSHSSIQDNCTIHVTPSSPTTIGDRVTMEHNSMVHGATIASNVVIGIGSVVLDDAIIKETSMVAAGAVVPPKMVVPSRHLAAGVPAKVQKFKGDPEMFQLMAEGYVTLAEKYLDLRNDNK